MAFQPPTNGHPVDPIISRLRPRTIGEILDQAFRLYRKYFLVFLAITAVVYVPVNIVTQLLSLTVLGRTQDLQSSTLSGANYAPETMNEYFLTLFLYLGAILAVGVVGGLLQYLSQAALTSAVADSYLDKTVSFRGAYRNMLGHMGSLIGAILLQVLIMAAIFSPIALLFMLAFASTNSSGSNAVLAVMCLAFLLFFPAIILYMYVFVRYQLIAPSIMVENLSPVAALRRSWHLVSGFWWRTFGLVVLLGIFNYIIAAGPAALIQGLVLVFAQRLDPVLTSAISSTIGIITGMFYIPLQLVATTLYYFDLRVRKEGYDLETAITQSFGPSPSYGQGALPYPQYGQAVIPATPIAPPVLGYGTVASQQGSGAPTQPVLTQPAYPPYGATNPTSAEQSESTQAATAAQESAFYTPPPEASLPSSASDFGQQTAPTPDWLSSPGDAPKDASSQGLYGPPGGDSPANPGQGGRS